MAEENGEAKEVPDYRVIAGLKRTNIAEIAARFDVVRRQLKALEKEKSELAAAGVKILAKAGVKSVMVGDLRTTIIAGTSSRISGTKLYKLGVSEKIIKKATEETPWTSLKVTPPKQEEAGGAGE